MWVCRRREAVKRSTRGDGCPGMRCNDAGLRSPRPAEQRRCCLHVERVNCGSGMRACARTSSASACLGAASEITHCDADNAPRPQHTEGAAKARRVSGRVSCAARLATLRRVSCAARFATLRRVSCAARFATLRRVSPCRRSLRDYRTHCDMEARTIGRALPRRGRSVCAPVGVFHAVHAVRTASYIPGQLQ